MLDYTLSRLYLPYFKAKDFQVAGDTKEACEIIYGEMTNKDHVECKDCHRKTHVHSHRSVRLRHISIGGYCLKLDVSYEIRRCPECGRIQRQEIPFKAEGMMCTSFFKSNAVHLLDRCNMTLKDSARALNTNRNLIREIDRQRLRDKYGEMKMEGCHPYIGIDEFSLHKNHIYATVVIDLQTGEVFFLQQGNTQAQAVNFIKAAGKEFMKQVKAVAMDMNAQYCKAFCEYAPHVDIVYDGFHIIKNYNDRVITQIRRDEQNRLTEEMEKAKKDKDVSLYKDLYTSYSVLKKSNFLLLANRSTLQARDEAAKEHNRYLYEQYEKKGLSIPEGERKWNITSLDKLENILKSNDTIQSAYVMREMLQLALQCNDEKEMKEGLVKFIATARRTKLLPLEGICRMIEKRFDGIISRAKHNISNGPLEGTNNMIKTIRRQAYGFRDEEYFFYKIWDASRRRPKSRRYSSQQFCA